MLRHQPPAANSPPPLGSYSLPSAGTHDCRQLASRVQKRAAVHVQAVIRPRRPAWADDEPPVWGTAERLIDAVRVTARRAMVSTPYTPVVGELPLRWGAQVDARPLRIDGDGPDDDAVAACVAKYVTEGASETGAATDYPITSRARSTQPPSANTFASSCAPVGAWAASPSTRLCTYGPGLTASATGGHLLTKSRAYSTTYGTTR
ncbi:replication initiator [Streptomyces canus]|uniref:replication initiator n=1 Tax=Streptomyces canus TaxID=58343 RepID=UPI00381F50B1